MEKPKIAPALERGLTIIESLATSKQGMSFTNIMKLLGVSKASTSRLLNVLRARGYVQKEEVTGQYVPGPAMSLINNSGSIRQLLCEKSTHLLAELCNKTGNTAAVFFYCDERFEMLVKQMHPDSVSMQTIGNISDQLFALPWAWIACAYIDETKWQEKVRSQCDSKKMATNCILAVKKGIRFFKANGFTFEEENNNKKNLRRFAAPIFDHSGTPVAFIALGGNTLTVSKSKVNDYGDLLKKNAMILSEYLGLVQK